MHLGFKGTFGSVHFFAGALALLGGCANIIGIEDRSLDPEAGAGSGSTGGSGAAGAGVSAGVSAGISSGTGGAGLSAGSFSGTGGSGVSATGGSAGASSGAAASGSGSSSGATTGSSGAGTGSGASGTGSASGGVDAGPDSQPVNNCPDPCVLATALDHPFSITSDESRVYWTEFGDDLGTANGSVKSCPVSGCGSGPLVYGLAVINPRGIAVDSQNVYWGSATYGAANGAIWSCAIGGCASPTKLAAAGIPFGVSVDATYVYWVDSDNGSVHRVTKPNAGDRVLYDGGAYPGGGAGVVEPQNAASDGTNIYFTDVNGDVFREAIAGGNPLQVATGNFGGTWPIALDPTNVYYGESGSIYRLQKTGTRGGAVFAGGISDPTGLAVDLATSTLYWSDWGTGNADDGTIGKIKLDGTGQKVMQASLTTPEAVTVNASFVFWLSNGTLDTTTGAGLAKSGKLFRTAK